MVADWTVRRALGDVAAVRREVEAWDIGGLALRYSHAKAVILEQDDLAVTQVNELLGLGHISAWDVLRSPLYSDLRASRSDDLDLPGRRSRDEPGVGDGQL
jgi:hypothetical protein